MSTRTRICMPRKRKPRSCYYVIRGKDGKIKKWHNIGRSTKIDSRVRAKRKVKRGSRKGHLGDVR